MNCSYCDECGLLCFSELRLEQCTVDQRFVDKATCSVLLEAAQREDFKPADSTCIHSTNSSAERVCLFIVNLLFLCLRLSVLIFHFFKVHQMLEFNVTFEDFKQKIRYLEKALKTITKFTFI